MTNTGPLARLLADDHDRLDALLDQAAAGDGGVNLDAWERFRRGLLRHIAVEERVLFTFVKRRLGEPLPGVERLRAEHSAIARLLCYRPDRRLLEGVRALLGPHNEREEGPDGVYARCEEVAGADLEALVADVRAFGDVKPAPYREESGAPTADEALAWALRGKGLAL